MAKFTVKTGDRVAYSVTFLRSIGMAHSDMGRAKGTVTGTKELSKQCVLAEIAWEGGQELPGRVNVANLAKVGPNSRYCAV